MKRKESETTEAATISVIWVILQTNLDTRMYLPFIYLTYLCVVDSFNVALASR